MGLAFRNINFKWAMLAEAGRKRYLLVVGWHMKVALVMCDVQWKGILTITECGLA